MQIAVRIDDVTATMDMEKFTRLEKLLEEHQIAPLIGIVPDNQDKKLMVEEGILDFKEQIRKWKEKNWVIAMHGFRHLYTTKKGGVFPLNNFSEFAGVPKEIQRKMIAEGKEKLRELGVVTDIFMAPAHSYDRNTLSLLAEAGFHYITDGFGTYPYRWKGLTFLPIAFQKRKDIKKKQGYTTLVFHTNTMKEEDFLEFEKILKEYKNDFISYEEYLKVKEREQTILGRIKEYGMATFKRLLIQFYTMKNQ